MRSALDARAELDLVVADASALVELVIDGRRRAGADVLLARYEASSEMTVVTAAHGLIEVINALRRLAMRGFLAPEHGLDLILDATGPRTRRIWALRQRMTAYDAASAAAAEALAAPLITVDGRLLRACRAAAIPAMHLDDLVAR